MNKDNIEEFVQANREAFDTDTPKLGVWNGIERQLETQRTQVKVVHFNRWRAAVAAVALLVAGAAIGSLLTQNQQNITPSIANKVDIENIVPELSEMEVYYQHSVQEKIQQLTSYEQEHQSLMNDLEELDVWREELKRDLLQAPKGKEEEIISEIIRSYQTKLELLEHVLQRVRAAKYQKLNTNETSI
ncbi:MAG: hypothetical protein AAF738_11015 [Bacteroidota bacterium]